MCAQQIADAQLKGTPADEFLSMGPKAEAQADATAEKVLLWNSAAALRKASRLARSRLCYESDCELAGMMRCRK